jgi:hypothetical protein
MFKRFRTAFYGTQIFLALNQRTTADSYPIEGES